MTLMNGKVAIVTGAGRGLGRAHALALARQGATVVVNDLGVVGLGGEGDRDAGLAEEVVRLIESEGGRAVASGHDIADWLGAKAVVDYAVKTFGALDIVVNNAAISRFASIESMSRDDWEQTIGVNLTGTAAMCHWAATHWRATGPRADRRLVNTSSGVGLIPVKGNPMYVAAKAGIAALTVACSIELAELGVQVNALAPVARTRISEFVAGDAVKAPEQGFDKMDPDHAARLVAFLASPACKFTGRVFGVVGDRVSIYDGWTVADHLDNQGQAWTIEELTAALNRFVPQSTTRVQSIGGVIEQRVPSDETLATLSGIR